MESVHLLDNPVWHSLTGPHAHLAIGSTLAKRYLPEVSFGVGVANQSDAAFAELAQLIPAGEVIGIGQIKLPESFPGWQTHEVFMADQMVCQQNISESFPTEDIIALTAADVPDMERLVDMARPGPFTPRSIEMGRFFGIRQGGELVAMAGERMQPPGYREICTVCTHPDWQGKGFARRLVGLLVQENWQAGTVPFLHVDPENTTAVRLYARLHFSRRDALKILFLSHA
ncbi:MAG: GNAT family N-acetyltransferase [Chloroflexota bacterium]